MAVPEFDVHVPGFRIEEINRYDEADSQALWELVLFESPWKKDRVYTGEEIERTIRGSVEPDDSSIIAAREMETGIVRSTMQIVAKTFMDAGKIAEMGYVSTHPGYTRRGLFTAVWAQGLLWLTERDIKTMAWNSNPAIPHRAEARRLYKKFGAEVVSISPNPKDMNAGTDYYRLNIAHGIEVWRELQAQRIAAQA